MTCARQRGAGHDGRGKAASPPLRPTFTRDDSRAFPVAASLLLRRSPACLRDGKARALFRLVPGRARAASGATEERMTAFFVGRVRAAVCRRARRQVSAWLGRTWPPVPGLRPRRRAFGKDEVPAAHVPGSTPRRAEAARLRPGAELRPGFLLKGGEEIRDASSLRQGPGRAAGRVRKFIRRDVSGARASGRHGASNRPGESLFRRGKGPGLHMSETVFSGRGGRREAFRRRPIFSSWSRRPSRIFP